MSMSRSRAILAAVAAGSLAAVAFTAAPSANAQALQGSSHGKPSWSRTLTTDVLLPFQLAVQHGTVYVADDGLKVVARLDGGSLTTLATADPGWNLAGVDVAADGSLAYTTDFTPPDNPFQHTGAKLVITKKGKANVVADIYAYELAHNPDARNTYGLPPGDDCPGGRAALEQGTGEPATYTGVVDPHPYSVTSLGNGSWAVADAGANAIFRVDSRGRVSTIAVMPPQPLKITQQVYDTLGLPDDPALTCLVGMTYSFEPVPTDVEVGPFGQLWVTTLPGGPEDASLGGRGSLYVVKPRFGAMAKIATGFVESTNVAVTGDGTAYVAELGANQITKVTWWGHKSTFKQLQAPLAVEVEGPWLYAATSGIDLDQGVPNGNGAILKFRR